MSLRPGNWLSSRGLAVLFVRDMGNYGQHRLDPRSVLVQLCKNTSVGRDWGQRTISVQQMFSDLIHRDWQSLWGNQYWSSPLNLAKR